MQELMNKFSIVSDQGNFGILKDPECEDEYNFLLCTFNEGENFPSCFRQRGEEGFDSWNSKEELIELRDFLNQILAKEKIGNEAP